MSDHRLGIQSDGRLFRQCVQDCARDERIVAAYNKFHGTQLKAPLTALIDHEEGAPGPNPETEEGSARALHPVLLHDCLATCSACAKTHDLANQADLYVTDGPPFRGHRRSMLLIIEKNGLNPGPPSQAESKKGLFVFPARPGAANAVPPETLRRADQALNRLPPLCRRALILVRYEGMSFEQAAVQMGLHPRSVRRFVQRAFESCQRELQE